MLCIILLIEIENDQVLFDWEKEFIIPKREEYIKKNKILIEKKIDLKYYYLIILNI